MIRKTKTGSALLWATAVFIAGCSDSSDNPPTAGLDALPMNHLQYLGTHNSYHIQPHKELFDLLLAVIPNTAVTLEYTHVPLAEQFERQGILQIELDIFHDPEGGLYAQRKVLPVLDPSQGPESGIPELDEPGLKVLHVQEIDYDTTCFTFTSCLLQVKDFSDANPRHLPIMILVEAKDEAIEDPLNLGFSIPLPFDAAALDTIDAEIRSVFPDRQIILPDEVRGDASTLEQAVLENGWPLLANARGRVLFALDNGGEIRDRYVEGHTALRGRVMFTSSDPGTPEAGFMKINDPLASPGRIEGLVAQGYLVRTRADADTVNARNNDTNQRDAALASGAHYISTDYPVPNPDFSDYQVQLPGGRVARCNPIAAGACSEDLLPP